MSAAASGQLVSVVDYLAGEATAAVKHEYVGGVVYAMAGASNRHATVTMNLSATLHRRLGERQAGPPGGCCRVFGSDTKVRVQLPTQVRFYYPDVSVVCEPNPPTDHFQDRPVLVGEVLSDSTRRIDEGEKKEAYLSIPTLRVYALLEPDRPAAVVYRRGEQSFASEFVEGGDAVIALPELGVELSLADLYDGVTP